MSSVKEQTSFANQNPLDERIALRSTTVEDERFLFELYRSTRASELSAYGLDSRQQELFLDLQFRARQQHYKVQNLEVDRRIILLEGAAVGELIVMRSASEIRLADIAVLPSYKGRGIGSYLIRNLLDEARKEQKPVTLHVEKSNSAIALYTKLGFKTTGDTGAHLKMECNPSNSEWGVE